jgi:hypothetical protein
MKLFSTMTVGILSGFLVLHLPVAKIGVDKELLQLGDQPTQQITASSVSTVFPHSKKQNSKLSQLNMNQVLSKLQSNLNLEQPVAAQNAIVKDKKVGAVRGLKRIEDEQETSTTDYTIPSGDVFLDRSAVGESRPADDTVH